MRFMMFVTTGSSSKRFFLLQKTYELYALVLHDCTKSTTKMRTIRVELDDYSVPGRLVIF